MKYTSIKVDNLRKTFGTREGTLSVLSGVSFEVAVSERLAIVGPSGSGKTTLLRILAGLETYEQGTVTLGGDVLVRTEQIVLLTQESNLFPWLTVEENVRFPLEAKGVPKKSRSSRVQKALEAIQMTRFKHLYPSELSGGMKQRTAFARAIISNPSILLLDEPFGALDAMARENMQDEFLKWWTLTRPTTVLVSHSVEEAAYMADKVIVLSNRPSRSLLTLDFSEEATASPLKSFTSNAEFRRTQSFFTRTQAIRNALYA